MSDHNRPESSASAASTTRVSSSGSLATSADTREDNASIKSKNASSLSMLERDEIKRVMDSDVAINSLLSRLKQSLLTCEEFTKFIRKKHLLEQDHAEELSKQYKHFFASTSSTSSSLQRTIHNILEFDGKVANVKQSYIKALSKMYDELSSLLLTLTRMRKNLKEKSRRLEKEVSDSIHAAEKAKARYNSLCQDWEKLKMTDPTKTKLTLRGSKTTKEQEEELLRKIDSADLEYKQKVDHSTALRNAFLSKERPKITSELKDLILEIDTAMTIQLQKYTIWTENLCLNTGITLSPIESSKSMKSIASRVTNEQDLYNYLNKYNSSSKSTLLVNRNLIPVAYKKHPSMATGMPGSKPGFTTNVNLNGSKNSIPTTSSFSMNSPTPTTTASSSTNYSTMNANSRQDMYRNPQSSKMEPSSTTAGTSTPSYRKQDTVPHRLPSKATTVSMSTTDSEKVLSHTQSQATMPPGTQKNFKTFGVPLENLLEYEQDMVPAIVRQCIYVIDKFGLDLEGIYRKSANVLDVSKLKDDIDRDPANISMILPAKDHSDSDIYVVASLLKAFFAALPSPLLPSDARTELKSCLAVQDATTRRNYMHSLVYKFPDPQYWTLRALIFHLKRVIAHEPQNRMNMKALCIIWGPTLVPPNEEDLNDINYQINVMELLFDVADQAFEPE